MHALLLPALPYLLHSHLPPYIPSASTLQFPPPPCPSSPARAHLMGLPLMVLRMGLNEVA